MPIAWLRVKWKKELVGACGADFRGSFVLLAALSLSFLLTGLSPSCCDSFLALVLNTDADKSWCSCEASGFLGDSFGRCTNSECLMWLQPPSWTCALVDSEDVQWLLCDLVAKNCTFVCIPQFSAILFFVLLYYKKAERLKQVSSS